VLSLQRKIKSKLEFLSAHSALNLKQSVKIVNQKSEIKNRKSKSVIMFKRSSPPSPQSVTPPVVQAVERITSVLGPGLIWEGKVSGAGGVRIEGTFEGQIALRGMLVVGESGRVTCENIRASSVIVAGAVRGNITAQKLEIRATGRVWGDVVTTSFVTEDGAFLRGQMRMEDHVDLDLGPEPDTSAQFEPPAA
jgi:cytoskeletal protein CcmA (bactofilin family)